ncbi:hypothetical protein AMJ52_03805, partial [candidate division TA06 bacterium DG_78]
MFKNIIQIKKELLIGIFVAITIYLIYLFSLCPTVYLIDSGELAVMSYTLGIAHPTGYPLYTLISYFVAHIPGDIVRNLNMLSALFSVVAAVFLYFMTRYIVKNDIVPIMTASLFAFSPTIWRISITNEVYALTALFAIILIYTLYKMHHERDFYIIMYLIGLSFTNHIIIFSLAAPLFMYIVLTYKPCIRKIIYGLLFVLLGVSLYVYLVARTSGGAELAWGNTHNVQRLLWHVTGRQYQVWMFSLPLSEMLDNLIGGFLILLRNFLFVFIIPVFFGFYYLFTSERKKFWLFISIFILNLLYTINYSIPDVESYYIPSFVVLLLVFNYGLYFVVKYLKWFTIVPIAFIIPIVNYHSCTLRDNTFGLDFGRACIEQLPESSLLLCTYWDIYSPILYLQTVKGVRQDLIIIDKELLRRTWYIKYIEEKYPQLYQETGHDIEAYLEELYKFEYHKPYNRQIIQTKFIAMLESFVDAQIDQGVYFTLIFPDHDLRAVKPDYFRIPYGLVFKIQRDTAHIEFDFSKLSLEHPTVVNDPRLQFNIEVVKK